LLVNIIEYTEILNAQAISWRIYLMQSFDSSATDQGRRVPQVCLNGIENLVAKERPDVIKVSDGPLSTAARLSTPSPA